jgi:putative nucleotidyltransferase with HDIG domain
VTLVSQREAVLEQVRAIPALPSAATRMVVLLRDPDVDVNEVLRAIEFDPSLTSNVLRLANSAYFAMPRSIGSLKDAIVRLGFNRIFQLVIASAVVSIARRSVKGYDLAPGELLRHSISVAIGAEVLGQQLQRPVPTATFTAGLLHDLGKLVLSTFLEVDALPIATLAFNEEISFEIAEARVLGIDHAEAGAALLECWNLPDAIVEVVRCHHDPETFRGDPLVLDLVHVADHLSLEVGLGAGVDGLNYQPSRAVTDRLRLQAGVAETVLSKMVEAADEFAGLLDSTRSN